MRMGLVAGAKLPVWEPKPGEAAPEPNPSLAYICSLLPRESCSALLQCSALILKARQGRFESCGAAVPPCENGGKLRISAVDTPHSAWLV